MSALQLLAFYSAALLAMVLAMGWASGIGAMALFTALLGIVAGGLSCVLNGINGAAGQFREFVMRTKKQK